MGTHASKEVLQELMLTFVPTLYVHGRSVSVPQYYLRRVCGPEGVWIWPSFGGA